MPGDAARHAYWGASSSRQVGGKLASEFLNIHEVYSNNSFAEICMDSFNNRVGIALGVDQAQRASPVNDLVMGAHREGKLQTGLR